MTGLWFAASGCAGRHVDRVGRALEAAALTPSVARYEAVAPPAEARNGDVITREGHRYVVALAPDAPLVATDPGGTLWRVDLEQSPAPSLFPRLFACDPCCGMNRGDGADQWFALELPDGASWGGSRVVRVRTEAEPKYLPLHRCHEVP